MYRVYRVYGYFQKSSYGIYFTFPTTRSGGWEMDLLYRVLETLKNPDLPPTAPPLPITPMCGEHPTPTLCISAWWWNSLWVSIKLHSGAILWIPLYIPHGYPQNRVESVLWAPTDELRFHHKVSGFSKMLWKILEGVDQPTNTVGWSTLVLSGLRIVWEYRE